MMNTSFSEAVTEGPNQALKAPVTSYLYRDIGSTGPMSLKDGIQPEYASAPIAKQQMAPGKSAQEINDLVNRTRAEAVAETEKRLREEYETRSKSETAKIRQALEAFQAERKSYFSRAESDVVHLALAIAGKILHREAQVDPLLVAALVRVAVDKLHDGSKATVRISPATAEKWREGLAGCLNGSTMTLVEDGHLDPDDCILETDLGSANFSIDAQLKEVEQGFFDLLAQRPPVK